MTTNKLNNKKLDRKAILCFIKRSQEARPSLRICCGNVDCKFHLEIDKRGSPNEHVPFGYSTYNIYAHCKYTLGIMQ